MRALIMLVLPVSALALLATGCSTTHSAKAKPLRPSFGENVDLSRYTVATVQPFEVTSSKAANDQAGVTLATDIANRLQYDFGPIFQTVRVGAPEGAPNELIVTGRITDYRPGSRAARLLGPGIGKADLEGELALKDGATGQPVMVAPIDKLWAWGHGLGALKGMEDMMTETAASAANLIARSRGWDPYHSPAGAASAP